MLTTAELEQLINKAQLDYAAKVAAGDLGNAVRLLVYINTLYATLTQTMKAA